MVGFRGILDTGWVEDQKMIKGKLIDGKRFWVGLEINWWLKMIKDAGSKFDDCSISPTIRHILLHWGYELNEIYFFVDLKN